MKTNILDYMSNSYNTVPEKIAFSNGTESLTFREVKERCDAIGTYVASEEIYQKPIFVFMAKHPATVTAFFGVVKSGNFYVPLDVEMKPLRLKQIIESLEVPLMICDEEASEMALKLGYKGKMVKYDDIIQTEADTAKLDEITMRAIDTDPIYIVFTSGSTGVPKGVVANHRSVIDYIEQLSETLEFDQDTIFGNQTPLYFDACLKEIYPTLKFGATTYLIPGELFKQPVKLIEYLNEFQINTICWVVTAMTMVSAYDTFDTVTPMYLRSVNFGSEVFPVRELHKWQAVLPEARFVNLYGPTECTGMCCYYKITGPISEDGIIPIGRPFKNTEIIILTNKNQKAGVNERGEICVRGASLTMGYYRDFARTHDVFIQNPLNIYYPEYIYRTGDIGYINEAGELIFCSRKDYQIKRMGYRVELGEIEACCYLLPEVEIACCIYDKENSRIRLFISGDINLALVVFKINNMLPRYMKPNTITLMDEGFPLTANGKIDREALLSYPK